MKMVYKGDGHTSRDAWKKNLLYPIVSKKKYVWRYILFKKMNCHYYKIALVNFFFFLLVAK